MGRNKLIILAVFLFSSCTFHSAKTVNVELQQAYTNYYNSDSLQNIVGYYLPKLHYTIKFFNISNDTIILPTSNYLEKNNDAEFYQLYDTDTLILVQEKNSKNITIPPNSFKIRTFTIKNLKTKNKKESEVLNYLESVANTPNIVYKIKPDIHFHINISFSQYKNYKLNYRDSMNKSKMEYSGVPIINIDTVR